MNITEDLLQKLQAQYPSANVREISEKLGPAENPAALLTWKVQDTVTRNRRKFAALLFDHLWALPTVPTAKTLSAWIQNHPLRPPDWQILTHRLDSWPADKPYPPLPDDDALAAGSSNPLWWTPEAPVGLSAAMPRAS
jgi:hypothetical protein